VATSVICVNAQCRCLFEIRDSREGCYYLRSCHKCGELMKPQCPFCRDHFEVAWKQGAPNCARCGRELKAEGEEGLPPK
jgi:hypothetical protein